MEKPIRIGVGGPVGSGKTALIDRLCRRMVGRYEIAAVTNDIYTKEDAEFLMRQGVLPVERIVGVETGGCPHTAVREDISMNLDAVEGLIRKFRTSTSSSSRAAATTSRPRSVRSWFTRISTSSTSPKATRSPGKAARGSRSRICW